MRIAMSTLAFGGRFDPAIASALSDEDINGVEIAPTAIWGTDRYPTLSEVDDVRQHWADHGIRVPSIQSLLYGRDDLTLFGTDTWPELSDHLMQMADIASRFGAGIMVFGSPRSRIRGDLGTDAAIAIAAEFFSGLGSRLKGSGVIMTLEPNPTAYGADFMTTYGEVLAVVDAAESPSIRPQIDTGCLQLSGEDLATCVDRRIPDHVHVSTPGLGLVPGGRIDHQAIAGRLRAGGYDRWITIEMLHHRIGGIDDIRRAARWGTSIYGRH